MRRRGIPLIGAGAMMGGFGGGMGSPLLTALLSGGLGYVVGSGSGQRQMAEQQNVRIGQLEQQQTAAASAPPQPAPQPPAPPPATQPSAAALQPPVSSAESDKLAQLRLLGDLHQSGVLTDAEFEFEKQRILRN